jgi:hypothetical protein
VRLAHAVVAAYQSGKRDGLRRRKRGVPTGPVLDGFGRRAVGVLVFLGRAMPHHRLLGLRMNALRQPGELKRRNVAFEAE